MKSLILSSVLFASLVNPVLASAPTNRHVIPTVSEKHTYLAQLESQFSMYRVGRPHDSSWEWKYALKLCRRIRRRGLYNVLERLPDRQYRYVIRKIIRISLAHRHVCPTQRHL